VIPIARFGESTKIHDHFQQVLPVIGTRFNRLTNRRRKRCQK
jgi:hypothetical protein